MSVTVSGTNRATFLANATSVSTDTGAWLWMVALALMAMSHWWNVVIADTTESTSVSTGSFKTAVVLALWVT
jgi:formylmethanofuran dehydrogenase subunit D